MVPGWDSIGHPTSGQKVDAADDDVGHLGSRDRAMTGPWAGE